MRNKTLIENIKKNRRKKERNGVQQTRSENVDDAQRSVRDKSKIESAVDAIREIERQLDGIDSELSDTSSAVASMVDKLQKQIERLEDMNRDSNNRDLADVIEQIRTVKRVIENQVR